MPGGLSSHYKSLQLISRVRHEKGCETSMIEASEAQQEISLEGTVSRVLFASEDSRFRVLLLKVIQATPGHPLAPLGSTVKVTGKIAQVTPGDFLTLAGRFTDGTKPGKYKEKTFQVEQVTYGDPVTADGVASVLQGLVPGLGWATACRLVLALGGPEQTLVELGCSPPHLGGLWEKLCGLNIRGGNPEMWLKLVEAWEARKSDREQEAGLASLGLPEWLRTRVREKFGWNGYRLVKEDPYRLIYEIEGVGFITADEIAQKLGITKQDPKRAEACLVHVLHDSAYDKGHTLMPVESVILETEKKLGSHESIKAGITHALDNQRIRMVNLDESGSGFFVLSKFMEHEKFLAERVQAWSEITEAQESLVGNLLDETLEHVSQDLNIDQAIQDHEQETGHVLDESQREAIKLVAVRGACVITGGPGTGKTEITRALVRVLDLIAGGGVALCAPTGRAAKRLEEATGRPASTIHRLLGFGQSELDELGNKLPKASNSKFLYNDQNPLPAGAVLVDESSMVDSELMASLLKATRLGTKLVFVGDVNQLPPVGPGAPFRDFLASGKIPSVKLTKIFRQAQDSKIVESAHRILVGRVPLTSIPGDRTPGGVFFLEEEDPEKTSSMIARCVSESIPEQFGIQSRDIQVLIPMHKGPVGTQKLNSLLQDRLNPELVQVIRYGDKTFKLGDRVRQTKNDYKREIVNGDLGYVCEVFDKLFCQEPPEDQPKAILAVKLESSSLEEKIFYCTRSELGQLQLAYAGTVHSSQGGEYPAVVIGLTRGHWIMLARTLLYTALTRAKKLCVIVGDRIALKRACENSKSEDRLTLLSRLL